MDPLPAPLRDRVRAALASYATAHPVELASSEEADAVRIVTSAQLCALWCHGFDRIPGAAWNAAMDQFEVLADADVVALCRAVRSGDGEGIERASRAVFLPGNGLFDVFSRALPPVREMPPDAARFELGGDAQLLALMALRRVFLALAEATYALLDADEPADEAAALLGEIDAVELELFENPLALASRAALLVRIERHLASALDDARLLALFARARHGITLCIQAYGPCMRGAAVHDDDDEYEDLDESDDPFHMLSPASLEEELRTALWAARQFDQEVEVRRGDRATAENTTEALMETVAEDVADATAFATDTVTIDILQTLGGLAQQAATVVTGCAEENRTRAFGAIQAIVQTAVSLPGHPEWGYYTRKILQLVFGSVDHAAAAFDVPEAELRERALEGTLAPTP